MGCSDRQGTVQIRGAHRCRCLCDVFPRRQTYRFRQHRRHRAYLAGAALRYSRKEPTMTAWLPRLLALPLLLPLPAAAPPAGPSAAEVGRLIVQLGDDDFDTREAATARLKEIGEPALAALREALTSDDLEVRTRA